MSGAVRISNVVGRRGRVLSTRFQATLEGGPELAAALTRLDDAVRVRASREAVLAAGGVLATEWRSRVSVLDANYQASLDAAPRAGKTKVGASGSVAPRKVAGLPDDEQPTRYAARLEFGDADRPAGSEERGGPPAGLPGRPASLRPGRGRGRGTDP